jgi:hypothetical protein
MITNEMVITFPVLFEPKKNLSGDLKFSCGLLIDKTDKEGIAKLKSDVAKAIERGKEKTWNGKVPKFRYDPLRDGDQELADGTKEGKEYIGRLFINASCDPDQPPGVVGPDLQPLIDTKCMYSGCVVRADISPFPYSKGGNNGIGWWLNNIMLVRDGERLDGKMNAVDAFSKFAPSPDDSEANDVF